MWGSIRHLMDPMIPTPLILLGLRQEEQGQEQLSKQSNLDHTCGNGDFRVLFSFGFWPPIVGME